MVSAERYLFTSRTHRTETVCFLMTTPEDPQSASVGVDPEQQHLHPSQRMLQDVKWHRIESMREDSHVSQVLLALDDDERKT